VERLEDNAAEQLFIRERIAKILPNVSTFADFAKLLQSEGVKIRVKKQSGQLLYKVADLDGTWVPADALDRMEDIHKLNYLLEDDTTIIFDRYIYSNIFNAVKTDNPEKFMKWIEELEFDKLKNLKPDYVFYLHVDPSISIMQSENRGKKEFQAGKKDIHETNFNLLAAADKYYIEYANSHGWFIIDEMKDGKQLSKDEVFDLIKEKIDCIYGGIK
jgi:thymidylate kinase